MSRFLLDGGIANGAWLGSRFETPDRAQDTGVSKTRPEPPNQLIV
jgi:hypothetical protein